MLRLQQSVAVHVYGISRPCWVVGDDNSVAAGDERQNLTLRSLTEQHGGLRYRSESSDICLPRSRRIDSLTKRTLICCRQYKEDLDRFQAMK